MGGGNTIIFGNHVCHTKQLLELEQTVFIPEGLVSKNKKVDVFCEEFLDDSNSVVFDIYMSKMILEEGQLWVDTKIGYKKSLFTIIALGLLASGVGVPLSAVAATNTDTGVGVVKQFIERFVPFDDTEVVEPPTDISDPELPTEPVDPDPIIPDPEPEVDTPVEIPVEPDFVQPPMGEPDVELPVYVPVPVYEIEAWEKTTIRTTTVCFYPKQNNFRAAC